jgi:hypothetical protein
MPSGIVLRYSQLCGKSVDEVETAWRVVKKQCNLLGHKNQWSEAVDRLRESLGISKEDGRVVFFEGMVESVVLSESPDHVLIQVKENNPIYEDLNEALKQSKGVMVVTYNQISQSRGGNNIANISETTSIDVGCSDVVSMGRGNLLRISPGLHVQYNGKPARILSVDKNYCTIRYLVDGQESGKEIVVPNSSVRIESKYVASALLKIWESMDKDLDWNSRIVGFGEILKYESGINFLPTSLVEGLVDKSDEVDKIELDDSDWNILLDKDLIDTKSVPIPKRPSEIPSQKLQPNKEKEKSEVPAPKDTPNIRTPSDSEIKDLIKKVGKSESVAMPRVSENVQQKLQNSAHFWDNLQESLDL